MASKSRGKKTGTAAGSPRKSKTAKAANDVITSSAAVALVVEPELPASEPLVVHEGSVDAPVVPASKAPRRNARRKTAEAAATVDGEEITAPTPRRSRARKSSPKQAAPTVPDTAEAATDATADVQPAAPSEVVTPLIVPEASAPAYADAFADAFLYVPDDEPAPSASAPSESASSESASSESAPSESTPTVAESPIADIDADLDADEGPTMDLPFIVDIPREVAVVDESPADVWVDQILEPTKAPTPARPVRAKAPVARPSARPAAKSIAKPVTKAKAAVPASTPSVSAETPIQAVSGTRWWVVAPVFLVLAVILFMNRPGKKHAPVPAGVLGEWTTAFWLYENQSLEIKPDTVVATLDEPEEGRYPITKVETADAGRETSVKITYRNASGDEKVLDFLADKDPTTALRFRAHTGLVWVKPQ